MASHYSGMRDMGEKGSVSYDYYNALYRQSLNKAVSSGYKHRVGGDPLAGYDFTDYGAFAEDFADDQTHLDEQRSIGFDDDLGYSDPGYYSDDPGPEYYGDY